MGDARPQQQRGWGGTHPQLLPVSRGLCQALGELAQHAWPASGQQSAQEKKPRTHLPLPRRSGPTDLALERAELGPRGRHLLLHHAIF
jgi:hypothetical protein